MIYCLNTQKENCVREDSILYDDIMLDSIISMW